MVGFQTFATGLHCGITTTAEDMPVATIKAMMIQSALLHTRLVVKILSRKRQIDIRVNMQESMKTGTPMYSSFIAKVICLGDR